VHDLSHSLEMLADFDSSRDHKPKPTNTHASCIRVHRTVHTLVIVASIYGPPLLSPISHPLSPTTNVHTDAGCSLQFQYPSRVTIFLVVIDLLVLINPCRSYHQSELDRCIIKAQSLAMESLSPNLDVDPTFKD
jgi:hypothetical protein